MTSPALSIDFELCSRVNLKQVGHYRWLEDKHTQIMCMAYKLDNDRGVWTPGEELPPRIRRALADRTKKRAWNAAFERSVFKILGPRYGLPAVDDDTWRCTMVEAAAAGLPLGLEKAGLALRLPIVKDTEGHNLMLRMARPRQDDAFALIWWHETDPDKYARLKLYCMRDVDSEAAIAEEIRSFYFSEHHLWLVDQAMNERGLLLDEPFIRRMIEISGLKTRLLDAEMTRITGGAVLKNTQLAAFHRWVETQNCPPLGSLAAKRLPALIGTPWLPKPVKAALLIRQQAAKTSVAKLYQMAWGRCRDDRLRGLVQFHGAIRTGRWAGRQAQIQNYPRPLIDDISGCIRFIKEAPAVTLGLLDALELTWGNVLDCIASCLRGCFVASPGHSLIVMDYSQIEARVLAWLADQLDILGVFESGADVYTYTAAKIGSAFRQLGKIMILGLGYGMGVLKFIELAESYDILLSYDEAEKIVYGWRRANYKIVRFWYALEDLCRTARKNPGKGFRLGYVRARYEKRQGRHEGVLFLRLPSGRKLVYRSFRETDDGFVYSGVDQFTKQWREDIRTWGGKIAENVTQAIARDLLADAMIEVYQAGIPLLGTVHDEIIAETEIEIANDNLAIVRMAMSRRSRWAPSLPLAAAGKLQLRYGKAA